MRELKLMLLLACAACSAGAGAPPASEAELLAQIRAMAADDACSASSQCHTLALGQRACGGPEAYVPWSSQRSDGAALKALAARHKQQRAAAIAARGEVSDCRLINDPGAQCVAGRCQLGGASAE